MTKRLFAYFLFILGFFTITFFRAYAGAIIPYPFLFWIAGLIMFLIGFFLLKNIPTVKSQVENEKLKETINSLKENGEKIIVELSKVEIKENNYSKEVEINGGRVSFLNAIGGDDIDNTKLVEVDQSVIVYTYNNNGADEKFISSVIPKDRETLLFKFFAQKITTLYVDRNNRKLYYFDLDFLYD